MSGGNTEEIYKIGDQKDFDNRMEFAQSLADMHPDVVRITKKYGRNHHHVDYSGFIQKPIKKSNLKIKKGVNLYNMKLKHISEEQYAKIFFNNVRNKNVNQ
jgi:hypothetical protein